MNMHDIGMMRGLVSDFVRRKPDENGNLELTAVEFQALAAMV